MSSQVSPASCFSRVFSQGCVKLGLVRCQAPNSTDSPRNGVNIAPAPLGFVVVTVFDHQPSVRLIWHLREQTERIG